MVITNDSKEVELVLPMKVDEETKRGLDLCKRLNMVTFDDNMIKLNTKKYKGSKYGINVLLHYKFARHLDHIEGLVSAAMLNMARMADIIARYVEVDCSSSFLFGITIYKAKSKSKCRL